MDRQAPTNTVSERASKGSYTPDVAIVGLAGRFPGAVDIPAFWRNLRDGVESVRPLQESELLAAGVSADVLADPNYVRAAAVLDKVDQFDAGFFGFSPKEASILDPQHRHFLECAWEALEDAGHPPEGFGGSIGVFAGCGMNAYFMFNLLTNPKLVDSVGLFLLRHTGNDKDFLSTRASYCFNLTGPSVSIQTACSTSLVAVHAACQSLLSGECDMALAGGVTIEIPHGRGYLYQEGEILSPDGHCRAFDAGAKGTVFGSGVGVVVLRRLDDALADGDQIYSVIKGSATNNDGSSKVGYLAPSVDGQAKAIAEALSVAGVNAESIGYVEAHGTGTPLGDPVEIAALTQAFRRQTDRRGFCAIGSLKTNIGHLDTAAGVAGLIKVALALKHRQIPPSLNFERPNPAIDFDSTPFVVNARLKDWPAADTPRRAGISALGVGGTNVHVIVEEPPVKPEPQASAGRHLLVLSARSASALDQATTRLADHLELASDLDLSDVAFTLQVGRHRFQHRRAVVCSDRADAIAVLRSRDPRRMLTATASESSPGVIFMFPGGGAQFPGMGAELYRDLPVYREELDRCLAWVRRHTGVDMVPLLFPAATDVEWAACELERPLNSVLSVFMTELALARQWMAWGIRPAAMIGHSLGEYTAACLAGVLSLEDALTLVAMRGAIFNRLPPGAMLSVSLAETEIQPLLGSRLSIAAVNAPELCVVSGPVGDIDSFGRELASRGHEAHRLRIGVAAHSAMLEPYLGEFAERLATIQMNPPSVPLISNETGTWASAAEMTDPQHWVRHLRGTVRFSDGLRTAGNRPTVFLEVGPGHALTTLAALSCSSSGGGAIPSMRHSQEPTSDLAALYGAAGRLWLTGQTVDWRALHGSTRRRVSLPTYPFEHQRHWIEPGQSVALAPLKREADAARVSESAPAKLDDPARWFWKPIWRTSDKPATRPIAAGERWLLLDDGSPIARRLARLLQKSGQEIISASPGQRYARLDARAYRLRPGHREDYDALIEDLTASGGMPPRIVHLWLTGWTASRPMADEVVQRLAFDSPCCLAQALADADLQGSIELRIVTDGLEQVADEPIADPRRAVVLGPALVIPRELPEITCSLVDVPAGLTSTASDEEAVAAELLRELLSEVSDPRVALRNGQRWVIDHEPVTLGEAPGGNFPRPGATYLVTGGLSGIGLEIAGRMALAAPVRLVLMSRRGLPAREAWDDVVRESMSSAEAIAIRKIRSMEAAGAEVLVLAADVVDPSALRAGLATARLRFGRIDGVLHAAGIVDDGPLQTKTGDALRRVLAPKVQGLLALEAALGDTPPDLLVLFSSTSAFLGLTGQVDYTGANAFLNAYARARNHSSGTRVVALQWGVWQEVGIAARAVGADRAPALSQHPAETRERHPLLGRVIHRDSSELIFEAEYAVGTHWILSEHRLVTGEAIVPGTAYIELARAAFREVSASKAVEIRDLFLLEPLHVRDEESRRVRTILRREGDAWTFSVQGAAGSSWIEHARATLTDLVQDPRPLDGAAFAVVPMAHEHRSGRPSRQESHLAFGPRWKNIEAVRCDDGRAVASCVLPPSFHADLTDFSAHPAMLDMATSAGLPLLEGYETCDDLFVPFSYESIRVYAPVGASIVSLVTPVRETKASAEFTEFNVILANRTGSVLMEVDGFTMRRTKRAAIAAVPHVEKAAAGASGTNRRLAAMVAAGIAPDEGWRALCRVLNGPRLPEVVVSSVDVSVLKQLVEGARSLPSVARTAVPPGGRDVAGGTTAAAIASMWQELLGVEHVDLDDDFFELGGHSLIAVRLVSRIEKTFKKKLRLATLFEARTVRQLAELVGERNTKPQWAALVPIQTKGNKAPFFCVHAVGGESLTYAALASCFAEARPFIAFCAPGHDGLAEPLRTIEEQAALYIREMVAYQPEGPYYIGGYSHGGRVALEMALQLEARGKEVAFVGIIDTWPHDATDRTWRYAARWMRNLVLWGYYDARQTTMRDNLARLRRGQRILTKHIARLWLRRDASVEVPDVGDDVNVEGLPESIRRVYQFNFEAFRKYRARGRCGAVTLFRSRAQPIFGPHQPDLGWGEVSRGPVQVRHIVGNHFSIVEEPLVRQLAAEMLAALDDASDTVERRQRGDTGMPGGGPQGLKDEALRRPSGGPSFHRSDAAYGALAPGTLS